MEKLKELRKQKKLGQGELSDYLQVARSTYSGYENGVAEPTIETLKKLADYYNCSIDYLVDHETQGTLDLGYLTEEQKTAVKMLVKLNTANFLQAFSYISGLYVEQ